jgi:hypothetical protein
MSKRRWSASSPRRVPEADTEAQLARYTQKMQSARLRLDAHRNSKLMERQEQSMKHSSRLDFCDSFLKEKQFNSWSFQIKKECHFRKRSVQMRRETQKSAKETSLLRS